MKIQVSKVGLMVFIVLISVVSTGFMLIEQQKNENSINEFDAGSPQENPTTFHNEHSTEAEIRLQTILSLPEEETTTSSVTNTNIRERRCIQQSKRVDSDDDELNNFLECLYGLDKIDSDTDGDGLRDDEEIVGVTEHGTAIPESDPKRRDIYVVIGLSEGAQLDKQEIAARFNDFHVKNHNGEYGITVHFEVISLNETIQSGNFSEQKTVYADKLHKNSEVYRGLLVTTGEDTEYLGRAFVNNNFAVVQSGEEDTATHEILHLVVGKFNEHNCEDPYHTCHGQTMLSPHQNENTHLSQVTITHIEKHGFGPRRTHHKTSYSPPTHDDN